MNELNVSHTETRGVLKVTTADALVQDKLVGKIRARFGGSSSSSWEPQLLTHDGVDLDVETLLNGLRSGDPGGLGLIRKDDLLLVNVLVPTSHASLSAAVGNR